MSEELKFALGCLLAGLLGACAVVDVLAWRSGRNDRIERRDDED